MFHILQVMAHVLPYHFADTFSLLHVVNGETCHANDVQFRGIQTKLLIITIMSKN